ncbi:hypothetical protein NE237_030116 [Protea cynaroides]|uniref:Uncharacterized protein n=1 Tax=Protea cynaroides TaxID=273540 RepID=A0A9Q0JUJ3_9MAGN|nr:hypothetical protein NE237_030116 [Protea cynaroides]
MDHGGGGGAARVVQEGRGEGGVAHVVPEGLAEGHEVAEGEGGVWASVVEAHGVEDLAVVHVGVADLADLAVVHVAVADHVDAVDHVGVALVTYISSKPDHWSQNVQQLESEEEEECSAKDKKKSYPIEGLSDYRVKLGDCKWFLQEPVLKNVSRNLQGCTSYRSTQYDGAFRF